MYHGWAIQRCSKSCQHSGLSFQLGDQVISRIIRTNSDQFQRQDYLESNLPALKNDHSLQCQWIHLYKKTQKNQPTTKSPWLPNSPQQILHNLIEDDQLETEPERYILALLLERQKKFKSLDSKSSTKNQLHAYMDTSTGTVFLIKEIAIPTADLPILEKKIAKLIG